MRESERHTRLCIVCTCFTKCGTRGEFHGHTGTGKYKRWNDATRGDSDHNFQCQKCNWLAVWIDVVWNICVAFSLGSTVNACVVMRSPTEYLPMPHYWWQTRLDLKRWMAIPRAWYERTVMYSLKDNTDRRCGVFRCSCTSCDGERRISQDGS